MKVVRAFFLILGFIMVVPFAYGQAVAIGQWKDYLSYYQCSKISVGQGKYYGTCQSSLFSYNTQDNSLQKYSKATGLSDVGTSVARFDSYNNNLFVGYVNGNIDIVQSNGQIVNVSDLLNSSVQGSKAINDVYFYSNYAFVSCGQGIMQMDMNQDIILNTFYIGTSGSALNVRGITIYNDTIFAATDNGVYRAYLYDANLNNYSDWQKVNNKVLCPGKYTAITTVGSTVYALYSQYYTKGIGLQDTLYAYSGGQWTHYAPYVQGTDNVNALESSNGYLVISGHDNVQVVDGSGTLVKSVSLYGFTYATPNDAVVDANLNIWIADNNVGIVESSGQFNGVSFCPPGPFSNSVFSTAISNNNLWITPGGYDQSFNGLYIHNVGTSVEYDNSWYRLLSNGYDSLFDITTLVIDPRDPKHAFAGSWLNGVIEYNLPNISHVWNVNNCALPGVFVGGSMTRNSCLAYDTLGNLWLSNAIPPSSEYMTVRKADGTWQTFNFSNIISTSPAWPATQILVTQSGAKWVIIPTQGILVYQDNGTFAAPNASNSILITSAKGSGALPSLNVKYMVQDQDGAVWVGTDEQVVVFYSPDNVLDGLGDWDAQNVYVTQNTYTQYLMQNQTVTAMAIDGANRKWIGTQGGGVFLMSADGTQQANNFTTSNSPLLSNNIVSISINPNNGEVFFGTDKGVISYRGTATEGNGVFGNVYAFPNPIPHTYSGPVAITGLVTSSDVKITDVSGNIVYHTTALGGQAIWNCTNFSGERVKSGVYLVFCASPDGTQTHVTKLLFLN